MLDASKSFDRVNFGLLFDKLITGSVPLLEYLLFGTHTKKCASSGVMHNLHPLVFLMVLSRVEIFVTNSFQCLYG